jgi:autophagy-related protein 18
MYFKNLNNLNFITFNQDYSCLSVGNNVGFQIFQINSTDIVEVYSNKKFGKGIGICEMLFSSSLIALVGSNNYEGSDPSFSPRTLHIFNTKTDQIICHLNFVTPILAVKLNKKRIIVVMETKIHIYDISTMKILHSIDTLPNPKGLISLSSCESNCFLAYPISAIDKGSIMIFDALTIQPIQVIHAHKTSLAKITINSSGTLLASASIKGTVIRIYSIPDGQQIYQFRRGTYPATIYCINFSLDSSLLCVSSDTGTVHIFKLEVQLSSQQNGNKIKSGVLGYHIPEMLTDMWDNTMAKTSPFAIRSFALLKLNPSLENLCAISNNNNSVMIVTSSGYFFQYHMDPKLGGELKLSNEIKIQPPKEEISFIKT